MSSAIMVEPHPQRQYEPNILRNPFEWMGIWTPDGWRTHRKRFGKAERIVATLPAEKGQNHFPGALRNPASGRVEWLDDLHLKDDPYTDGGIYPCDPRVLGFLGEPRWSVSHSLLCFPCADHSLFTHEYVWNMENGDLTTHFRHHVPLEECLTDSHDGATVKVRNGPISQVIEGNRHYNIANSAVRGVWTNPEKTGPNLYVKRSVQVLSMLNGTYVETPHAPVVQCRGVWEILPNDPIDKLFHPVTGDCLSLDGVIAEMGISLDEPKLAMFLPALRPQKSKLYQAELGMLAEASVLIDHTRVGHVQKRQQVSFDAATVGYAGGCSNVDSGNGYFPEFDFNDNGIIDLEDLKTVERHLGRRARTNLYVHSYFGPDWLSICVVLDEEQRGGSRVLADYDYGAGYDGASGTIRLFETPGPNQKVWVEYYSDSPAMMPGGELSVIRYREVE